MAGKTLDEEARHYAMGKCGHYTCSSRMGIYAGKALCPSCSKRYKEFIKVYNNIIPKKYIQKTKVTLDFTPCNYHETTK